MPRFPLVLLALLLSLPSARAGIAVVDSGADSGPGTLRQALLDASSGVCAAPCGVAFRFEGPQMRIALESELPPVTTNGVKILAADDAIGVRTEVLVDGSRAGANAAGLRVSGVSDFRMLAMRFANFGGDGVVLDHTTKANLRVIGFENNGGDGLVLRESGDAEVWNLEVVSNRGGGVRVQHSERIRLEYSRIRTNGAHGVLIEDSNAIYVAGNTIKNNGGDGVRILGNSFDNMIEFNEYGANGSLALDLGGDGPTPQRAPVIDAVLHNRGTVRVRGHLDARPNTQYSVAIWEAEPDPSGFGEGVKWIAGGGPPARLTTDANGHLEFVYEYRAGKDGFVTATASRFISEYMPFGETLEFSNSVAIVDAPITFEVTNTSDSGPGSLRDAIETANATECTALFVCNIVFNILTPPNGDGVWTIRPRSPLPVILRPGIRIDATTQTNVNPAGPSVEIDGSACGVCNGLEISAAERTVSAVTIRGLAINFFIRNGVRVVGFPPNRFIYQATIENCYIGTDPTGSRQRPNGESGISIQDAHVSTVSCVLSGNSGDGMSVVATTNYGAGGSAGGNRICTDRTGLFPLANGKNGVAGNNASVSVGGGVIGFCAGAGVLAQGENSSATITQTSIHSNGALGIDIRNGHEQVAPVIESARFEDGKTRVRFSLAAKKVGIPYWYRVELYTSSFTDASGRGEAKRFLTSKLVRGENADEFVIDENLTGKFVTMTNTFYDGFALLASNTSEFSESVQVIAENCRGANTTLRQPADGSVTSGGQVFMWDAVPGAITYQLWTMRPGGPPKLTFAGPVTTAPVALAPGVYEWWVETRFPCYGEQTPHRTIRLMDQ